MSTVNWCKYNERRVLYSATVYTKYIMWVVFSYNLNLKLDLKTVEQIWYWNYFLSKNHQYISPQWQIKGLAKHKSEEHLLLSFSSSIKSK